MENWIKTVCIIACTLWFIFFAAACANGDCFAVALVILAWPAFVVLFYSGTQFVLYRRRTAPARLLRREVARQQAREQAEERRRLNAERQQERQAHERQQKLDRDVAAARAEVERSYQSNAAFLHDVLPPSLFKAEIETAFQSGILPLDAWKAARDLIARMQPLVQQGLERQRAEQQRLAQHAAQVRKVDREIASYESQIHKMRASSFDTEGVDDETKALEQAIEHLQQQREMLVHPS